MTRTLAIVDTIRAAHLAGVRGEISELEERLTVLRAVETHLRGEPPEDEVSVEAPAPPEVEEHLADSVEEFVDVEEDDEEPCEDGAEEPTAPAFTPTARPKNAGSTLMPRTPESAPQGTGRFESPNRFTREMTGIGSFPGRRSTP